jgi:hypothetical protein
MSRKFEFEFPYERELPVTARAWLCVYIKADYYRNRAHYLALGVAPDAIKNYRTEAKRRQRKSESDVFSSPEVNLFSLDSQEMGIVFSGGGENEDIIDLAREVITRSKFQGYGNATNLMYAKRVQLCIDSHYLNGRTGMVISARHDEWLIHFDNGFKGYFKASELSNIQEQAILLGGVA